MPNSSSANKRLRQSKVRRVRNRAVKSAVRTQLRKVREAVQAGETEKAESEFRTASRSLDKAATKKVIHANTASRLKSRLSKHVKQLKQAPK